MTYHPFWYKGHTHLQLPGQGVPTHSTRQLSASSASRRGSHRPGSAGRGDSAGGLPPESPAGFGDPLLTEAQAGLRREGFRGGALAYKQHQILDGPWGARPTRIGVYSRSCQNHHQGFTEGCTGQWGAQTLIGGLGPGRKGMGGGPQLSSPSNAMGKGSSSGQLPFPAPPCPVSLGGGGLRDVGRECSVSGPRRGRALGWGSPASHALTTLISQGTVMGACQVPLLPWLIEGRG